MRFGLFLLLTVPLAIGCNGSVASISSNSAVAAEETSIGIETTSLVVGQQGAAYGATLAATGGKTPYSWSVSSGVLPTGLSLSSASGIISGIPSALGLFAFAVVVTDSSSPTQTAQANFSIMVNPATLAITTTSLPVGQAGISYSATLLATGGVTPYSWSVVSGTLLSGLSLTSGGIISGTPSAVGSVSFTVQAKDTANSTVAKMFSLSIAAASQPLAILTITVPSGVVGSAYSTILVASGGVGPYTWSLGSGMLPAGLSLNSAGTISGIPTALSDSSFTIEVQDSMGNSITQSLNISIAAAVLSSSDSLLNTGMATSASYAAPGTDSETAIVASSTNVNSELWELVVSPWNVNAGSGTITMSYSGAGSIVTQVNLTGLDNQAVNGYPFIFYGGDQWGDQIGGQPPQFPAQLSAMSSLVADATYSLTGTFGGDIDVLYDEWLIPSKTYTGGSGGALEVEVLPYCQFADFGGFTLVKTFSQTVTLNGVQTSMNFDEYSSGQGGGNAVLFIPVNGVISGEVRLDLLAFMNEGATTAGLDSSWWLSGIELGTEFGDGSTENFTFTVTKLDIEQSLAQVVSAQ